MVDWGKCVKQKRILSLHLNCLNYLLGKPRSDIKSYIELLFDNYKDAFKCLNILVAIRNSNEVVITRNDEEIALKNYFISSEMVYEFMCDSGLVDIFCSGKIKDLNDFVFGVEVCKFNCLIN